MKSSLVARRFGEIADQMADVERTKKYVNSEYMEGDRIDDNTLLNWSVKARNLLVIACGKDSEHYIEFTRIEKPQSYRTNYEKFQQLAAVVAAAREDFEGGYLNTIRNIIHAEVFENELEQAKGLLKGGYAMASAVIAGVVLETALRTLCENQGIAPGKMDKMNADLAKAGIYNVLVQKRVTALAEIRNNAAHGHSTEFSHADVADMISYIENFLSSHLQ